MTRDNFTEFSLPSPLSQEVVGMRFKEEKISSFLRESLPLKSVLVASPTRIQVPSNVGEVHVAGTVARLMCDYSTFTGTFTITNSEFPPDLTITISQDEVGNRTALVLAVIRGNKGKGPGFNTAIAVYKSSDKRWLIDKDWETLLKEDFDFMSMLSEASEVKTIHGFTKGLYKLVVALRGRRHIPMVSFQSIIPTEHFISREELSEIIKKRSVFTSPVVGVDCYPVTLDEGEFRAWTWWDDLINSKSIIPVIHEWAEVIKLTGKKSFHPVKLIKPSDSDITPRGFWDPEINPLGDWVVFAMPTEFMFMSLGGKLISMDDIDVSEMKRQELKLTPKAIVDGKILVWDTPEHKSSHYLYNEKSKKN